MAILKKGSKGPEVRKLQEALIKNGFKLKVDGDFGSNTEDAVKKFQKKAKLKADGKVGPMTEAALKAGGPLPVMTVPDYTAEKKEFQTARKYNGELMSDFAVISSALDALDSLFLAEIEKASAIVSINGKHWDVVEKMADDIIKLQRAFEAKRLSDPAAAEKIARQCEAKHKAVEGIGKGKLSPNIQKLGKHFDSARSRLATSQATIDKILSAAHKRAAAS